MTPTVQYSQQQKVIINKYVRFWGLMYIHTCRSCVHMPRKLDRHVSHNSLDRSITLQQGGTGKFIPFWASGGAKFTKMGNSLPGTPTNRRAKFDAASFILGREIRNRANKQTHKRHVWITNASVRQWHTA